MSKWAGKFIIGLTGNIATGKSVVRKMLEQLGAYGIDADALAHRAISKGAPGFQPVLDTFGNWLLAPDGEVDRSKLGKVVFSDPEALKTLEQIIHPLVIQAVDYLIRHIKQQVVVIEAIKLIESGMGALCDSIWVTHSSPDVQLSRLMNIRKMSELEARRRMDAQPPQELKLSAAHVVINNEKDIEDTWRQVTVAWEKLSPWLDGGPSTLVFQRPAAPGAEAMNVLRAKPRHAKEIADFLNRIRTPARMYQPSDILIAYGEKAFLLLEMGQKLVGLIGWQVENLVARTMDMVISPQVAATEAIPVLVNEMERSSQDLQCEASLVFVPSMYQQFADMWQTLGYERRETEALDVQAWQEAARESFQPDTVLYFKQLRQDRVLRPI